ncbi:MAG TPA: amidohydrolase family protein [Thermoanaerobaculia bacterium]|nr:amidohydrolase family protein [Thermoanaerobaculia bacterium]
MRRSLVLALILALPLTALAGDEASDLRAARTVFETNVGAIRHRDRDAYLSCYLHSDHLAIGGPAGFNTGYDNLAKQAGTHWPDTIDAADLHLVRVHPGVVYGTYRYRVRWGADEHSGISERLFVETRDGWKITVTGAVDTPSGTPASPRAITGATLIDGRGGAPVPNANIVLRDGKIDCAGTAAQCPVPEGIDVIDAKGTWITPGLIDAHVHFSQTGFADGRPDSLDLRARYPYDTVIADLEKHPERFGRSYLCAGVTSVFDVGGYAWTLGLHDRFENDTRVPHVEAAGPLLSTLDHWLNLPAERQFMLLKDADAARAGVHYLKARGSHAVKVWYIVQPNLTVEASAPAVTAAGEEAKKAGLPMIVHATGLAEAKAALRAGATLLVHSVWDLPVDQEFIDLAKKNGTILCPTMTVARGYVRMFQAVVDRKGPAVDDPNHCVDRQTLAKLESAAQVDASLVDPKQLALRDQRTAEREKTMAENLRALVAAGIPIATGTDAGNPLTLHGPAIYAEMETMQAAGMTPSQVIVSSTSIASRALGLEKELGTIEKGKSADLLILTADPSSDVHNFRKIRSVVRSGVVRGIEELSAVAQ